jgi:hypothetical protein
MLVFYYFKGLQASLEKGAEDAGFATGEQLKKGLRSIFSGRQAVQKKDAEAAIADTQVALQAKPEAAAADARDAARMRLVDALVANGLSGDRALTLTRTVQEESSGLTDN